MNIRIQKGGNTARERSPSARLGFTMIEIAISLAVIGFALVAIIGILPTAMNVQKENRQETIINQDATILMEALRSGSRGLDDLTNYVIAITNYASQLNPKTGLPVPPVHTYGYTYQNSTVDGGLGSPQFQLTNGFRILGLLATPRLTYRPLSGGVNPTVTSPYSNHVVAYIRSMSGPASEKFPQTNPTIQDTALSYRLITDVCGYGTNFYDTTWTNFAAQGLTDTNVIAQRLIAWRMARYYETNLHDVRLTFRWPVFPNGDVGPSRQIYRTMVGGALLATNEVGFQNNPEATLYFFQPRTYVQFK